MTHWRSEPLAETHDLIGFDCGVETLTRWLVDKARGAHRAGTARTYVWTDADDDRVVAYYAITPTQLVRGEVSSGQAGGASIVPAYLLAKLALDTSLHGQGLGAELLYDALDRCVDAADRAGGRLIVVDAIDDNAAGFYRHHRFTPVKGDPHRLVVKVETVRNALGKPDPKDLPGGLQSVSEWLDAVRAAEPTWMLWLLLDDPLRLALAQGWIMNRAAADPDIARRDRDDLAYALAPRGTQHPLAVTMLAELHQHWKQVYTLVLGEHGILHKVNTVAPDLEAVVLTGPEHVGRFEADAAVPAHTFITRLMGDRWIIAATSRRLPEPGWPPTERDVSALPTATLHMPESGPEMFAWDWLRAIARDETDTVWAAMTTEFRLSMSQIWIANSPQSPWYATADDSSRDDVAHALSTPQPSHDLFTQLAVFVLHQFRIAFANIDPSDVGPGRRPRPIGPDLELVRLFYIPDLHRDEAGNYSFMPGTSARNASVLVRRHGSEWRIAGIGHHLLHPGWPPIPEAVADGTD